MKTTISNLFYLKRAKANSKGQVPIFHRVTVNGKRIKDNSTGKYIEPEKWTEGSKIKGTSEVSDNDIEDFAKETVKLAELLACPISGILPDRNKSGFILGNESGSIRLFPLIEP